MRCYNDILETEKREESISYIKHILEVLLSFFFFFFTVLFVVMHTHNNTPIFHWKSCSASTKTKEEAQNLVRVNVNSVKAQT